MSAVACLMTFSTAALLATRRHLRHPLLPKLTRTMCTAAATTRPRRDISMSQAQPSQDKDGETGLMDFKPRTRSDMQLDYLDLTFLGTSSGAPSATRNQQSLALQMLGETWLLDCGEAAQHRLMRTTTSAPSIRRIFISHLHGDHVFGLPGMLCAIATGYGGGTSSSEALGHTSADEVDDAQPVIIYGPQGLRAFLRASLGNAYATLGSMKLQINELVGLRAIEHQGMRPHCTVSEPLSSEVEGESIEPDADGVWRLPMDEHAPPLTIEALELDHSVPTVGWVLTERSRPGKLDPSVIPILKKHSIRLTQLKSFKLGVPIELPDGTVLEPSQYVGKATSRKLAILSDMRALKEPAVAEAVLSGANLLVHEATNACTNSDELNGVSPKKVERTARKHGHSTPQMAAALARRVKAQHLLLTHFSVRYVGDSTPHAVRTMDEVRALAEQLFGAGRVTAAVDLMTVRMFIDGTLQVNFPRFSEATVPVFVPHANVRPQVGLVGGSNATRPAARDGSSRLREPNRGTREQRGSHEEVDTGGRA
jgi:ribonuclease Z